MDREKAKLVAEKLFRDMAGAMTAGMVYVGTHTGLFRAMQGKGAMRPDDIVRASGMQPRYVEEWLKGMASAGYLAYDPQAQTYLLSDEHAYFLASEGSDHFAGGMFEIGRTHVIGRRVDEVARERDALDDAGEVVAIDAHRQFELDGFVFGFPIAREAVAAERKRQRGEARVVRRIGEAVGARRQESRERARAEAVEVGIVRGFDREQHARERTLRPRQQQVPAGARLKTGGIGKSTGAGIETRAQVRPCRSGDERHGYGSGSLPAQEEDRMNRSLCHEISATTPVTPGASRPGWAGF